MNNKKFDPFYVFVTLAIVVIIILVGFIVHEVYSNRSLINQNRSILTRNSNILSNISGPLPSIPPDQSTTFGSVPEKIKGVIVSVKISSVDVQIDNGNIYPLYFDNQSQITKGNAQINSSDLKPGDSISATVVYKDAIPITETLKVQ